MEISEIFKDKRILSVIVNQFSIEVQDYYKKLHEYILKSNFHFEIQKYHNILIYPFTDSEVVTYNEILLDYENEFHNGANELKIINNSMKNAIFKTLATICNDSILPEYKESFFREISNFLQSSSMSLGLDINQNDTPDSLNLLEISNNMILKNQTPALKLAPKFETFFYEDMLRVLVDKKAVDKNFRNADDRRIWVRNAFYFGLEGINNEPPLFTKLNWLGSNKRLADWLMFLKNNLINYPFDTRLELNNWVFRFVNFKGKNIIKPSTNFDTLDRNYALFSKEISLYSRINSQKLFEYSEKNPDKSPQSTT